MDAVKVVYKDQYDKGYPCNPHLNLSGDEIRFYRKPFELIREINDKEFLVKNPYKI